MPLVIKPAAIHIKDDNGNYYPQNIVAEKTTEEYVTKVTQEGTKQVTAVNSAGSAQVSAVQNKGDTVLASIPSDYTSLQDDVNSLRDDLRFYIIEHLNNGFSKDNLESTEGYWSNANGAFVPNSNYLACSSYARVKPSTKYSSWYNNGTVSLYTYVCFYDSTKKFVGGSALTSSNIITSPSNAKYCRISVAKARKDTYVFCEGETFSGYSDFGETIRLDDDILLTTKNYSTDPTLSQAKYIADAQATGNITRDTIVAANLKLLNGFNKNSITSGVKLSTVDGVTTTADQNYATCNEYVLINPSTIYTAWETKTTGDIAASTYYIVCWYDAGKNFISGSTLTDTNAITAPETAAYVRLSVRTSIIGSFAFCEGSERPDAYNGFGYSVGDTSEFLTEKDLSYFDKSVIVSGIVTNGDVVSNADYYSLKQIECLPYAVTIKVKAGWRLHLFYYIGGEQTSPTQSWWIYDSVDVPAGTPFSFYFQKTDGSSTTLQEAQNATNIIGYSVSNYDQMKPIPAHYYIGEKISLDKNGINATYKYKIEYPTLSTGGLQACDLHNGVLFVCRGDDILMLYDYSDATELANLTAPVGHGNAFQFGSTKDQATDEFPVAYASPFFDAEDTSYTVVNKIRVTRSASSLLKKYKLPVENAGYYGGACINGDESTMYVVGFKQRSYTDGTNNALIISSWDLTMDEQNEDGSYTPAFANKFEIDFRMFIQGVKYINGKLFVCCAPHDENNVFDSSVFVVDPIRKMVVSEFVSLPITIKNAELEDCFLVPSAYGYNLGILMANGRTQELTLT